MANKHIAAAGETWDSIAFKYYTDEFQSTMLMENNRLLIDKIVFDGGEVLTIPDIQDDQRVETLPPWRQTTSEV